MSSDEEELKGLISSYSFKNQQRIRNEVSAIFDWLHGKRSKDNFDAAAHLVANVVATIEERVLEHFAEYVGGRDYIHKDEAWRLACRQREFVREACARMAEDENGTPTQLSEAIREMEIGENVKVIPDYSKRVQK